MTIAAHAGMAMRAATGARRVYRTTAGRWHKSPCLRVDTKRVRGTSPTPEGKTTMSGKAADDSRKRSGIRDKKDLYLDHQDRLDQRSTPVPVPERRKHRRYQHRVDEGLEVILDAFDEQPVTCRVRPRNLSQGGIAFLHEAYLYPETRCTVVLISATDQPIEVSGRVVGCRHICGKLHEIAMAFDRPIDAEDFRECIEEAIGSEES
ncbi:MAG: PilZ domain-containing protein [Phycisphaerae bacterium]